jgi:hypothetical protein
MGWVAHCKFSKWVDLFLIATPRHSSKWLNWSSYAKKAVWVFPHI